MPARSRRKAARLTAPSPPATRLMLLFTLALAVAGTWAYSTSFPGVFVADDVDAIVLNPKITSLSTALTTPPDTTVAGRPVVSLTLAVNYALAKPDGLQPWGYHAVNLGIHLAAGLALFGLGRRTLMTHAVPSRLREGATAASFAVALLWILHPLQTAAVTYVIQRAESLMGLFFLLTLYCVARATDPLEERWRSWCAGAVVACALGMASKEVMVVAPLLAALWIWIFRPDVPLTGERGRLLLGGLAATWLILAWLVASDARGESVGFGLGGWTWWAYLRTQAGVIVQYLRLAIVPSPLVFMYAWPPAPSWPAVAPQIALLVTLVGLTAFAIARRHPLGFLGAWFFLVLAPSSSVRPIATEIAAEHRMYLPLAAVIGTIVPVAFIRLPRAATWVFVAVIALAFGGLTHARNKDYWSLEALMQDTVEKQPANAKALVMLGGHLLGLERFSEAERHLRAATTVPRYPGDGPVIPAMAHMYLGSALAAQNKLDEAIPLLEKARALDPDLGEPHAFLGEVYATQGRLVEAAESFDRAVAALPNVPPLLERAARLRATAHDPRARDGQKAMMYAQRAVEMSRSPDWRTLDTLAAAYAEAGRFPEAVAAIDRAMDAARMQQPQAAALLAQRLSLYRSGQPLREPGQ
jgi:tetratricopeptide (TPR) repeat protein